eukprot:gene7664-8469_t
MATNTNEFQLSFYGSTEKFDYGSEKEDVLQYIKRVKSGRAGDFKMVLKDGKRKPFLGKVFEKREDIEGYEFVPEDATTIVQIAKDTVRIFGFGNRPDSSAIIVGSRAVVACEHSLTLIKTLSADGKVVDETYQTDYWLQTKTERGPRGGFSQHGRIKVRLFKCHSANDWALLYRVNGTFDVNEIAIVDTTAADMTKDDYYDLIRHKKGVCLHCPVKHLMNTTHVGEMVLGTHLADIRVQSASKRHVVFSGHEMAPGSSGGGVFVDGKLIAMNQAQITEVDVEAEVVPAEFCDEQGNPLPVVHEPDSPYRTNSEEKSLGPGIVTQVAKRQRVESETVASRGDVYNGVLNSAIILCRCKRFMAYLQEIEDPNFLVG